MFTLTKDRVEALSYEYGYLPEILEKVCHLLHLIQVLMADDFLLKHLVLKGGTAINLFCTDKLPRLSVDADFNYVGKQERSVVLKHREKIEGLIVSVCQSNNYTLHRNPLAYVGGKMVFSYRSVLRPRGWLEVDLNYLYRSPLWEPTWRYSSVVFGRVGVNVLDIHELVAGKLHALLDRDASRYLFDSHELLSSWPLDTLKLRQAFTVYAGMRKGDWRNLCVQLIQANVRDVRNKLFPVLHHSRIPSTNPIVVAQWVESLVLSCQSLLHRVLPFDEHEMEFLCALEKGLIKPELLSDDPGFCRAVRSHPALHWRIQCRVQTVQ